MGEAIQDRHLNKYWIQVQNHLPFKCNKLMSLNSIPRLNKAQK